MIKAVVAPKYIQTTSRKAVFVNIALTIKQNEIKVLESYEKEKDSLSCSSPSSAGAVSPPQQPDPCNVYLKPVFS